MPNHQVVIQEKEQVFLMEHEGAKLLRKFDLPVAKSILATTEDQAITYANEIGYPVVLKGMSPEITHKTEAGIVKLNIQTENQLVQDYNLIYNNAKVYDPSAALAGILVQEMVPEGIELIFGIKKDPIFGHQLIIGLGGTMVEIMQDFTMRMMPVSEQDVETMLSELKSAKIIEGYRGQDGIEKERITNICMNLNRLVEEHPEIVELDLNPVMFSNHQTVICDVRVLMAGTEQVRLKEKDLNHIDYLINPKSIAVVGASTNETKNGGRLFRYIAENEFPGELYPINPSAEQIRGYKAYPSIVAIPNPIDLACIIVAAQQVPEVMEQCVKKGVKAAIIYSSGFAEIGEEGRQIQNQIMEIAKKGNILVLGPNSIGIASPSKKIYTAFGAALESKVKVSGKIGFVSQSGAMGSALLSRSWEQGIGFSRWISVANEADLSIPDFINVLANDELTEVITVFMEGIKDVKAFEHATKAAFSKQKPVLVYKTGRTDAGKKAVQSHTGSMAGEDAVYEAVFKKYNVLRVSQIEELVDIAAAFEIQPLPKGNRIGIITASGGVCSILADLCSSEGLEVSKFTNNSELIKKLVPEFGSSSNPIDVTAEIIGKPEMFKKILEAVVADEGIDGVLVMMTSNADPGAEVIAKAITDVFKHSTKPIILGRLGANSIAPKGMEYYKQQKFVVYPNPEKIVRVMKYLVDYSDMLRKSRGV